MSAARWFVGENARLTLGPLATIEGDSMTLLGSLSGHGNISIASVSIESSGVLRPGSFGTQSCTNCWLGSGMNRTFGDLVFSGIVTFSGSLFNKFQADNEEIDRRNSGQRSDLIAFDGTVIFNQTRIVSFALGIA
jgi:hypothetical protein